MTNCPACQSTDIRFREKRNDWICDACDHRWRGDDATPASPGDAGQPLKIFLSYGRLDARELAERLAVDLAALGHEIWIDSRKIIPGESWQHEITDGLRSAQLVIALMSPHSVRTRHSPESADGADSVCLGEIAYALFNPPPQPVIPVMAAPCEPPLAIYHLDYVELTRWKDSESQYRAGLDRLLKFVEAARQRKAPRYRSWFHQLQPWDFAAFLHDKRKDFTGREWLFDEIDAWRATSRAQQVLLITGDPGVGKSAIVAELVHHNVGGQVIAYHCCQSDTRATLEPWRFVRSVAAMLASRLPEYASQLDIPAVRDILSEESCRQDPGSAFERGILTPLETVLAPEEGVRYILIDALDEALTATGGGTIVDLLSSRLSRLPGWLRIVATTRKEPAVLHQLQGLPARELRADDPHNLDDLKRYMRRRLATPNLQAELVRLARETSPPMTVDAATERSVEALTTRSGGNFLYVRHALDEIEHSPDISGQRPFALDRLDELPAGLTGMYGLFFRRQFGSDAERYADIKPILEVICAAREPVTGKLLAAAAGLDLRGEFPQRWRLLAQFLPVRTGTTGETTYAPFHKSLVDWLASDDTIHDSHFGILVEKGHARLADQGWHTFQTDAGLLSPYHLRHLPHHLLAVQRHEDLLTLLTNFDYLQQRVEAGEVFDLVLDLLPARELFSEVQRQEFDPWFFFVRTNAPFLSEHPECFFQQAYNEPIDSPMSQAAQRRWAEATEGCASSSASRTDIPKAFLEWINRPATWQPPACLTTLSGHTDRVNSVAVTPEGGTVISGSHDANVKIWDARTGACRHTLSGHTCRVTSVAVIPDGTTVVSGSHDNSIKFWDTRSGACRRTLSGHTDCVTSVAVTPDGETVASGAEDCTVKIWDARTSVCRHTLSGHTNRVSSVAVTPDGGTVVSGAEDCTVKIWDARTGACRHTILGHRNWIPSVSVTPDGETAVSGSEDRTVKIWDAQTGVCRHTLADHNGTVYTVTVTPERSAVVSGSSDKSIKIWDARTGALRHTLSGHTDCVTSVAVTPDGGTIVSGSWDQTVRIWDARTGPSRHTVSGHTNRVTCVAVTQDGRTIISGSRDYTVKIWDASTGSCRNTLSGHTKSVCRVAVTPDGGTVVSGSDDQTVKVWDTYTGDCLATHPEGFEAARLEWAKAPSRTGDVARADAITQNAFELSPHGGHLVYRLAHKEQEHRPPLAAPGPFSESYGPLADENILAFTANGEAHWFRIRRRDPQ